LTYEVDKVQEQASQGRARRPKGRSVETFVVDKRTWALSCKRHASVAPKFRKALDAAIVEKVRKLEQADEQLLKKALGRSRKRES